MDERGDGQDAQDRRDGIDEAIDALRATVERVTRDKEEVRKRVSDAVAEASVRFRHGEEEVKRISAAVLDAAVNAAPDSAGSAENTGVLHEVVDGLGDGFASAAQAAQLAIEEARAKGKHFADEDLRKVAGEFRALGQIVAEALEDSAKKISGHLSDQAGELRQHVGRTIERVRPPLEAAAKAATDSPKDFAKEAGGAGADAAQQAVGALFNELGALLQKAGGKMREKGAARQDERDATPPGDG